MNIETDNKIMTDSRSIELIQARLDGEISAAALQELESRLQADPELVIVEQKLTSLAEVLARVEAVEPPAGLRQRILSAVIPSPQRSKAISVMPRWRLPQMFGYGLAAAFGAAVAAIALQVGTLDDSGRTNVGALVGTMSSYGGSRTDQSQKLAADPANHRRSILLDSTALSGSIDTYARDGLVVLEFDLAANKPVEIMADYSPSGLSFDGIARTGGAIASLDTKPGQLRMLAQKDHRYVLLFSPDGQAGGVIELRFVADGRLLEERSVEIPSVELPAAD